MLRYIILTIGCFVSVAITAQASDVILSDVDLDITVLKKSVESLDDAEALTAKLDRLQERYTKAADAEKKAKVVDDLNELKVDLVTVEGFPDAWRATLAKALKINYEHVTHPYPTNSEGDMVNLTINGRVISGRVNSLSEASALIGSTTVPISDLPPSFHVRRMLQNRRDYVLENYTEKRQVYLKSLLKKLPPHMYRKNGYIEYEGEWVPTIKVAERIEERINQLKAKAAREEEKKEALLATIKKYGIMAGAGFGVLAVLGLIIAVKVRKKG